nr:serine--tRNA ligase [Candidatus Levybacteria bacterium]
MLDIKFIRQNPEKVQKAAKDKGIDINVEHVLELDNKARGLDLMVQKLREDRNRVAKNKDIEKGKEIKIRLEKEESALKAVAQELNEWFLKIPNPAKPDVKVGKDESDNEVIRKWGEPKFSAKGGPASGWDFKPLDHLDLGEKLGIIDVKSASKVSGARFAYLKGDAVLLEFALIQFGLETLIKEGFIPIVPPVLVTKETMKALGYMENGGQEDMYHLEIDDLYLVGTAEHSLVPMHKDEILNAKDLPKRYVGFSTAFRREAGSYGKDTKGILRVHQFDKLEMVSFVKQGQDDREHEYLLSLEEKLFKALEIPYQVVKMCTGDLGFPAARKYDLEAWMPGQDKYREVTSVSTVTDFQSRRLNIKYQDGNDKKYVNILNGTAFAIGRTIIAILENYQNEDGSIEVPKVLQKFVGKSVIR